MAPDRNGASPGQREIDGFFYNQFLNAPLQAAIREARRQTLGHEGPITMTTVLLPLPTGLMKKLTTHTYLAWQSAPPQNFPGLGAGEPHHSAID